MWICESRSTRQDGYSASRRGAQIANDGYSRKSEEFASREKDLNRRTELLEKSREQIIAAQNKVKTTTEEIIRVLREHETTMISKLNDILEEQQRDHATQQKNFDLFATNLRSTFEYCDAILQRSIGAEILQAEPFVFERCEELMKTNKVAVRKLPFVDYVANKVNLEKVRLLDLGDVVCGYTDPSRSIAEGKGLQAAYVGRETEFTVTVKDEEGKLFYCEEDCVTAIVRSSKGEQLKEKIEDNKSGKYRVSYTPKSDGQHDVVVTINGEPLAGSPWSVQATAYQYQPVFTFGSEGKGPGQFNEPAAIAVNQTTGNIAVADTVNNRIQMFSSKGRYLREFGLAGPGNERLILPISVAVTSCGDVVVLHGDLGDYKISMFTENGQFIKHINQQHLKDPRSVSVGRDGHLIVCDWGDKAIKILSPDGTQLLRSFRARGGCPLFAIHHQDKFFVTYLSGHLIKVFDAEGKFLYNIGSEGSGDGHFKRPHRRGLAVDKFNHLIVCHSGNKRLQVFTLKGKLLSKIGKKLTGILTPSSIAVSNEGQLFVTDRMKSCVHVLE